MPSAAASRALSRLTHPAKRRLALEGPTTPGTNAARTAAVAVAAECRLQGVAADDALALVLRMPFQEGSTPRRLVRKQLERSVRFAYGPPDGRPILSGCCQDPRPSSGNEATGALRNAFAVYCDEECARSCPMLRAIRNPSRSLHGTPYEPLDASNLWMHGTGLGEAGRLAFQMIALLALTTGEQDVSASRRYLCMKSGGRYNARHFGRVLARLDQFGIVRLLDKRTGLRRIEPRDHEWIVRVEERLGVAGAREENVRDARKESDDYLDWLLSDLRRHGDEHAALAAWNPAPPHTPARDEDEGRAVPRFLQSWGGLTGTKNVPINTSRN